MRLIANLGRALAAAIALLAVTIGPPWALIRYIGNPYPGEGVSLSAPLTDAAIIGLFAVVVWLLWVQLLVCILVEIAAALTDDRIHLRVPYTFPAQQHLARRLVGAVIVVSIATPALGGAALGAGAAVTPHTPDGATSSTTASVAAGRLHITASTGSGRNGSVRTAPVAVNGAAAPRTQPSDLSPHDDGGPSHGSTPSSTVTVMRLDSLWSIADRVLGDGEAWTQIAALNEGRTMNDGTVFTAADHIRPGWQLRVPATSQTTTADPTGATGAAANGRSPSAAASHDTDEVGDVEDVVDAGDAVVVRPGDTLSQIAEDDMGQASQWPGLYRANRATIGADPNLIRPGQVFVLPGSGTDGSRSDGSGATGSGTGQSGTGQPGTGGSGDAGRRPHHTSHSTEHDAGHDTSGIDRPAAPAANGSHAGADGHRTPAAIPAAPSQPTSPAGSENAPRDPGRHSPDDGSAQRPSAVEHGDVDGDGVDASVLRALLGAAVCLAAGALALVTANRRRQFRNRRIGRLVASTPEGLGAVERAIVEHGSHAHSEVEFLDHALRHVAASCALSGDALPQVGAVVLDSEELTLLFTAPAAAVTAPGWAATGDGRAWVLPRSTVLDSGLLSRRAPYPALVSVGQDEGGRTWLLDLEAMGVCSIAGDPQQVDDLTRFMVAELAVNAWSDGSEVLLAGPEARPDRDSDDHPGSRPNAQTTPSNTGAGSFAGLVELNPSRLRMTTRSNAMTRTAALVDEASAVEHNLGADVLTRRRDGIVLDTAGPVVVVVTGDLDANLATNVRSRNRSRVVVLHSVDGDPTDLVDAPASPGATATPSVGCSVGDSVGGSVGGSGGDEPFSIELADDGTAFLPMWGISLRAFGLSRAEGEAMAALVASTRDLQDQPMPAPATDDGPLGKYALADGSLREEYTEPRHTDGADRSSLLPQADEVYVDLAATTVEDLAVAAPSVPQETLAAIAALDPTLETDLADWADPGCLRPKVRLLGTVDVTALGGGDPSGLSNLAGTISFIAYLACQDRGVTKERVAEAFGWKTTRTVENRATDARYLLGVRGDGIGWLPEAGATEGARRGAPTYGLIGGSDGVTDGVLVDFDLFRRLQFRAQKRGDDGGDDDLVAALSLVAGAPFEASTDRRFPWLFTGQPFVQIIDTAIAKVAHLLATRALVSGRTDLVRMACETARAANPHTDVAWLDLAAAAEADSGRAAADALVRTEVVDRFDEDLSSRTEAVLDQRDWATG